MRDANMKRTTSATCSRMCDEVQDLTQSDLKCFEDIYIHRLKEECVVSCCRRAEYIVTVEVVEICH